MLVDTHAHLDQAEFDDDRAAVLERARAAGVEAVIAIGVTAASSRRVVELAAELPGVYAAVGMQPNYIAEALPGDWDDIQRLAEAPGVVAIGETGLDRHWDFTPFDLQQDHFARHMRLAHERDLPFVVHMRDCDADIMAALKAEVDRRGGPLAGVMHSFTGDAAMAVECVAMGLHISFAGMVTYKKSNALRECAASIPADRLLVETDSPYLSPEPVRSVRRNEPAHVRHTAELLAQVRGVSFEQLAEQTTANARRLFRLPA